MLRTNGKRNPIAVSSGTILSLMFLLHFSSPFFSPALAQTKSNQDFPFAADRYYSTRQHQLAQIEYDRLLFSEELPGHKKEKIAIRSAMNYLRLKQPDRAYQTLQAYPSESFPSLYLKQYTSLKLNQIPGSLEIHRSILSGKEFTNQEKDLSGLLAGSIYLEKGNYDRALAHYRELQKWTDSRLVKDVSGRVQTEILRYHEIPRKSMWISGILSAIIPGSGQVYSSHTADGVSAFFFSMTFIGSASAAYSLENSAGKNHTLSSGLGLIGAFFYLANISGAVSSARRYNIHQERLFQERIRGIFFNDEFIERSGNIGIRVEFD